jgi:transglutaminase-like putative cysteine protease
MAILASVHHLTHYKYDRPVTLGPQVIRLRPAPHSRTRVVSHSLKVSPKQHFVNHQQDPYGNWMARFVFPDPVRELKIEVDLVADMTVYNPFDFFVEEAAEKWPFDYPEDIAPDLVIYRTPEPAGPRLQAFLDSVPRERNANGGFRRRPQRGSPTRSATSSAWSRACRRRRKRSRPPRDRAATPAGCSSRRSGISGLRRASCLGLPDPAQAGHGGA